MSSLTRNAFVRLTNRRILQIQGIDALRFVQAILTNDMRTMDKPSSAIYGAFLNTKGRVLGDCNVVQVKNEQYMLEYDAVLHEELTKHWKRYKLRMKVVLEDKSDTLSSIAVLPAILSESGIYDPTFSTEEINGLLSANALEPAMDAGVVFRDPRGDEFGLRALVPSLDSLQLPSSYGKADLQVYTDRRISLGAAEGVELLDSIPLESNLELLHGISFKKGCYVGQELTARTQFKGNVRKRHVPVALISTSSPVLDVVKKLSNNPFRRMNAESSTALREVLAAPTNHAIERTEKGMSIVKPGSTKPVGVVVTPAMNIGVGLAMMRLEHLFQKDEHSDAPLMSFTTLDGKFHAIPYQPMWWPSLDLKTGKMILS